MRFADRDRRIAARALGERTHGRERASLEPCGCEDRVFARGHNGIFRGLPHRGAKHRAGEHDLASGEARAVHGRIFGREHAAADLVQHLALEHGRIVAVGHAGDQPLIEKLGLERRDEQARELAIAREAFAHHDRATSRGVVAIATEALLAVPVRRAGRFGQPLEDRARAMHRLFFDAAHAQLEPVRADVPGAQLVTVLADLEDRDVLEYEGLDRVDLGRRR